MMWNKILANKPGARPASAIMVSFKIGAKRGTGRLLVSIPSAIAGKPWETVDRFDGFWGDGENPGKLKLEPAKDGQFKIGRFKGHMVLPLGEQPQFSRRGDRRVMLTEYAYDKCDGTFVLTLPDWTVATYRREEPAEPAAPESLSERVRVLR